MAKAVGVFVAVGASGAPGEAIRAARSVHLGFNAPASELFYHEMTVEESTPGSYFMACGWNTGYFGIQELADQRKVVIFSVWDPTKGDDPKAVKPEDRVELLHSDPEVRIKRFGGEGTGGQCMMDFPWAVGATNRFLVRATVEGGKTAYAGYVYQPAQQQWKHLVTFRTRTSGQPLKELYSFVEDFRRDGKSANERRRARFGNAWVKTTRGEWVPLTQARFTASSATWEAKETIDAGVKGGEFFLTTGGDTKTTLPLRSQMERSLADRKIPGTLRKELEDCVAR
ncbi:MAG: DUF3472 domain-containing protein [Verrucomicrobiota bacterium]